MELCEELGGIVGQRVDCEKLLGFANEGRGVVR